MQVMHNPNVAGYTDVDSGCFLLDRHSITGYWSFQEEIWDLREARNQNTCESKCWGKIPCYDSWMWELLWLMIILDNLKFTRIGSVKLFSDYKPAIKIIYNPVQHDRPKYVDLDSHFIKEKLEIGLVCIPFVLSKNQLAVMLSK